MSASGLRRKIVHVMTQEEASVSLLAGTVGWGTWHIADQANGPGTVTEGALVKSRVVQNTEISTGFQEDLYCDRVEEKSSNCG